MSNDLKQIIREEYIKCASSPSHFMKKYCYIQHPQRGRILFGLYPFQDKVLTLWKENPYSIVLKSRQLGISTLAGGYALWLMLFHRDKNILCLATKQDTAKNMVTKVKFMFDNLPSWLKIPDIEYNKLTLRLNNGSQIKAVSAASDAGRSEAVSLLIVDECAFIDNIETIWASAQQTLSCIEENSIVYTDAGLFRIKDLYDNPKIGFNDLNINIFDKNNQYQQSSHFYKSPKSQTYKINFKDGNSIITTKEHPLLDINERWIRTEDLKPGDKIKCYYNQNTFGKTIDYPKYNNAESWLLNNTDLAYLIGLWIANGNYNDNGISIICKDKHTQQWLKSIGFTHSGRKKYILNSIIVKSIFQDFIQASSSINDKHVPNKILSSSKEEQIAFLQGYFDNDGNVYKKGISCFSISNQLIQDIHVMLLNFGIRNSYKSVFQNENNYKDFKLSINKENSFKFYKLIGFRFEKKQEKLKLIENINYESSKTLYYNKIVSIEEYKEIETYDLKIPINESFIANNIVNHNTGGGSIVLSCVTDETYVRTNKGIKQLKSFIDYKKNDGEGYTIEPYKVLGYEKLRDGNLIKNNGLVKTYIFDTGFSKPLECSFNHKLWVYDAENKTYSWKEAQYITKKDYIALNIGGDIWGNNDSLYEFNK